MFSSGIVNVFSDVFVLIWIMVFMFAIDWELSLMTLTVLPLLIYCTFVFRKKVRTAYRDVRFEVARLNSATQEMVSGMSTVQLYGREESEYKKHLDINQAHTNANVRSVFYYAVFYPTVDFLSSMAVAIIIWYAGGRILSGLMTIGTLISFVQYTEMFFRPVRDLSEKYNILQSAMASSERIFQVLDDETIVQEPGPANDTPAPFDDIEFRNVSFAYDEPEYVLRDVSFKVPRGSTVAIVGATGSGKTTIISLLNRFYDIQKGEILLGGRSLNEIPSFDLRSHISLVLQDVFLFSGTIRDNITLGRSDISDSRVREVCSMVGLDGFISGLPEGLDTQVKERGATLSVGQKQLLAFARALAFDPSLLILDEATSSIDTETEQIIQNAISRLLSDRTAIVIAHRLSTIQHADNIIVMHKGRIRETGTHQELLALGGIYSKLYQLQYKDQERMSS
jgi:ATP-binding cassette subfamily B protein